MSARLPPHGLENPRCLHGFDPGICARPSKPGLTQPQELRDVLSPLNVYAQPTEPVLSFPFIDSDSLHSSRFSFHPLGLSCYYVNEKRRRMNDLIHLRPLLPRQSFQCVSGCFEFTTG